MHKIGDSFIKVVHFVQRKYFMKSEILYVAGNIPK